MSAGWVAAAVRARSLLDRTLGVDDTRALARADSWGDARQALAQTSYGRELDADADRAAARRAAAAATMWQIRVLAGWLPPGATRLARLAAGPMEIANIERQLARFDGSQPPIDPIPLGSLGVAWPRISAASTAPQIAEMLSRTAWGDPGGDDATTISLGLRVGWVRRAARAATVIRPWAHGIAAVLIARETFAFDRDIAATTARDLDRLIGTRWRSAADLAELAERLPESARWPLAGLRSPVDVWRAELAIVDRVAADAHTLATSGRYGRDSAIAVMALLLVDLWLVTAAIEAAGRGRRAWEVFDAVAS